MTDCESCVASTRRSLAFISHVVFFDHDQICKRRRHEREGHRGGNPERRADLARRDVLTQSDYEAIIERLIEQLTELEQSLLVPDITNEPKP